MNRLRLSSGINLPNPYAISDPTRFPNAPTHAAICTFIEPSAASAPATGIVISDGSGTKHDSIAIATNTPGYPTEPTKSIKKSFISVIITPCSTLKNYSKNAII